MYVISEFFPNSLLNNFLKKEVQLTFKLLLQQTPLFKLVIIIMNALK